ncbi:sugar transferase [Clostridium sp. AM58-1XD]|uniref:sugar transferase n=1 Tax=Clostridium sp. AM58-1XD TaxID=2292307 RepID=UPI000E48CB65|nr:sugar transferase [Clostridium sp. AM58-1XD]RGY96743.1 sugar transferase [Clostridium sp. AM58-1XD]
MRWQIADWLAEDRLPAINAKLEGVYLRQNLYSKYIKRLLDIVVSLTALIVTLPINFVIGIITFFDVGRPIFFSQERIGKDGRPFTIVKFRNMRNTMNENGELLPASQRVTKWGTFVRRTSLDELLNFWSVLKGDMSLIGPRPLVPQYLERYSNRHKMRLAVRPGLECPPRGRLDHVLTWQDQFENDVWYVENISFLTDCKLAINLVRFAFDRKNSAARAGAKRGTFMGYDENAVVINYEQVPQEYIERAFHEFIMEKKVG